MFASGKKNMACFQRLHQKSDDTSIKRYIIFSGFDTYDLMQLFCHSYISLPNIFHQRQPPSSSGPIAAMRATLAL